MDSIGYEQLEKGSNLYHSDTDTQVHVVNMSHCFLQMNPSKRGEIEFNKRLKTGVIHRLNDIQNWYKLLNNLINDASCTPIVVVNLQRFRGSKGLLLQDQLP